MSQCNNKWFPGKGLLASSERFPGKVLGKGLLAYPERLPGKGPGNVPRVPGKDRKVTWFQERLTIIIEVISNKT